MIFISAGHYPAKPGACHQGFCEYDEAVRWQADLVGLLGPGNALAVPTGYLRDKVAFINARLSDDGAPDVAVEVHFNAAGTADEPVGRGCETLHFPGSARGIALAEACQAALAPLYPPNRGVKEGWYRMDPANGPDYFLKKVPCPAVILEPDFIHRREIIAANRERACKALAKALLDFVTEDG